MANKNRTFTEPTINDMTSVIITYEAGDVNEVLINVDVKSDEPNVLYRASADSQRNAKDDFPPGILNALTNMIGQALTKFNTDEGF